MELQHQGKLINVPHDILGDIIRLNPCAATMGAIQREVGDVNDYLLECKLSRLNVVFSVSDDGNKGRDTKYKGSLVCGYDLANDCIIYEVIDVTVVYEGGGEASAATVINSCKRLDIHHLNGQCTDNAGDVFITMTKSMQEKFSDFVGLGCGLHQRQLILVNAYHQVCDPATPRYTGASHTQPNHSRGVSLGQAFGEAKMGECSALRIGFMVHYVQVHYRTQWDEFLRTFPKCSTCGIVPGASAGRCVSCALNLTTHPFSALYLSPPPDPLFTKVVVDCAGVWHNFAEYPHPEIFLALAAQD